MLFGLFLTLGVAMLSVAISTLVSKAMPVNFAMPNNWSAPNQ